MLTGRNASAFLPSSLVRSPTCLLLCYHGILPCSFGFRRREEQSKRCSSAWRTLAPDMAPVRYHDLLCEGKPQAAAALFRGVEQVEDALLLFTIHARALVADHELDAAGAGSGRELDASPFGHG